MKFEHMNPNRSRKLDLINNSLVMRLVILCVCFGFKIVTLDITLKQVIYVVYIL